jgi:hypothetical protein
MANCNELFHEYNSTIRLSDDKRIELIGVRDNLRGRIQAGYQIVTKGIRLLFLNRLKIEFLTLT